MAKHPVVLNAVFDDVARTVTISGMGQPPAGPDTIPVDRWFGQTGPGFEFVLNVQAKNITAVPTAIYFATNAAGLLERYLVEFRNGAWVMPGTLLPSEG